MVLNWIPVFAITILGYIFVITVVSVRDKVAYLADCAHQAMAVRDLLYFYL